VKSRIDAHEVGKRLPPLIETNLKCLTNTNEAACLWGKKLTGAQAAQQLVMCLREIKQTNQAQQSKRC